MLFIIYSSNSEPRLQIGITRGALTTPSAQPTPGQLHQNVLGQGPHTHILLKVTK